MRSTVPLRVRPRFVLPYGSIAGSVSVPVRVTGSLLPLTTSTPSTSTAPPAATVSGPPSKRSSGWFAVSKKSGDARCSESCSLSTSMLAACAAPRSPFSSSVASKLRNVPSNGAMPMYTIRNATVEWVGSLCQVPLATAVRSAVVLTFDASFSCFSNIC